MSPHNHSHRHAMVATRINTAFWAGIGLNAVIVLVEFFAGIATNSLSLLSDAGHNLSDVAGLGLSLLAYKLSKSKSTAHFTYGLSRSTILVSLTNAIILLIAVGGIGWEAVRRFMHPEHTEGVTMAIVAGIGIVINSLSALLFFKDRKKDLNVKGAYLHLASDAVVSFGVVIAGLLIAYTGYRWLDPLVSLLIMGVVLYGTWGLLRESLNLSLDAVPEGLDLETVKKAALKVPGLREIHHVHVWALSTTENALTAHILPESNLSNDQIQEMKDALRHAFEDLGIRHITLETEYESCGDELH